MNIKKVLIVGAGTMVQQISFQCAMQGFETVVYNHRAGSLDVCRQAHQSFAEHFQQARGRSLEETEAALARLSYSTDLPRACEGADLVNESILEDLAVKLQWYPQLCEHLPDSAIITTNTSTFMPSQLVGSIVRPERLSERTTPELAYLEAKWASLMSYGLTVDILSEVLPLEGQINTTSIRRQVERIADRTEQELGPEKGIYLEGMERDWGKLPRPEDPITVGIDGGFVRGRNGKSRGEGHFEVIAGKSIAENDSKCFAYVTHYDEKPKRRLYEVLKSQGMQMNQQVTFLSDGAENVRTLQYDLNPHAEYILDWFHITMRLTVMRQMAKGLPNEEDPKATEKALEHLKRIKWYLWHGNVYRTMQAVEDLAWHLDCQEPSEAQAKLFKTVEEFERYIHSNQANITNYGYRYRNGERISTGFVESTINQVVSKRFVKKQQMRWTERGAHLLLQVRTKVLNDQLRDTFEGWYPEMKEVA